MADSKIVAAVGSAVRSKNPAVGKAIEVAMAQAAAQAQAEGVTDPDRIRSRMLAARDQVKKSAP